MALKAANVVTVSQKGRGSEDATLRMESTRKHQSCGCSSQISIRRPAHPCIHMSGYPSFQGFGDVVNTLT